MTADSQPTSTGNGSTFECPPRRQLAGVFVGLAVVSILLAFKVLLDLIALEHYGPAISGFIGLAALGVGLVFAARACRGLKMDDERVTQLEVIEKPKSYKWSEIKAVVYCVPRSADAAEALWFEIEGGRRCGVPLKCAHQAARVALARDTKLKIMRYYQLSGNDFLEGDEFAAAEKALRSKLEESAKAVAEAPAQPATT